MTTCPIHVDEIGVYSGKRTFTPVRISYEMIWHYWDMEKALDRRIEIARISNVFKAFHYILCVKKA